MNWRLSRATLVAGLLGVALGVGAADRPFLITNIAAAEEDDDAVWSLETWGQRIGGERFLSIAPEYAFDPLTSLQFEATRSSTRRTEAELEFKRLFNHIERDGWGWGLVAAVAAAQEPGLPWRQDQWSLRLPFSLRLGAAGATLHANLGVAKPSDAARQWQRSIAGEVELARNLKAFAELGRTGDERLVHGGLRLWVKREKLALDLAYQQLRRDGMRDGGWILGLGLYDW